MAVSFFDRYKKFRNNGEIKPIPGIKLKNKSTDKQTLFRKNIHRMDKLSQEYYGSPLFGFLIMLANPQYGGLEFNIPDNVIIKIPYPLDLTLEQYNNVIENDKRING